MIPLPQVPAWVDDAACAEDTAALFYPESRRGKGSTRHVTEQKAKALCSDCPVRLLCLDYGMADDWGIYGGLTADERRALRGAA